MCRVQVALLFATAPRVYSFRINHCMLVFYHFVCAMGYCGWSSDKGLCSEFVHVGCVDKVVDGPLGGES